MTGSPFSTVLGNEPDDSTFHNVETTQIGDTTTESGVATTDSGTESSVGVEVTQDHTTHESGQSETQGQSEDSGQSQLNT